MSSRTRGVSGLAAGAALAASALLWVPSLAGAQSVACDLDSARVVRRVRFDGSRRISPSELERRVRTTASSWGQRYWALRWLATRRCVTPAVVRDDASALESFYALSGYPGTTVSGRMVPAGENRVDVRFTIVERPEPIRIAADSIVWGERSAAFDTAAVLRGLYLHPDSVFNRLRIRADRDTIQNRLRDRGFPAATVTTSTATDSSGHAWVELKVYPGPFARIAAVNVTVTPHVGKPQMISKESVRDVAGFNSAEPYRQSAFLDANRRLYDLRVYSYSLVAPDTSRLRTDSVIDVNVVVREDLMRQWEIQPGWGTIECGMLRTQYVNQALRHTPARLDLGGQISKIGWARPLQSRFTRQNICRRDKLVEDSIGSSKLNYNLSAGFSLPASVGAGFSPSVQLFSARESGYKAYLRETKIGFSFSGVRQAAEEVSQLGYSFEFGHTDAEPAVLCFVFRACDADARDQLTGNDRPLGVASLRVTRNRVDNPLNPTRGTMSSSEVRISNRLLGSAPSLSFYKGGLDGAWYHSLSSTQVIAGRLRGALVYGGQTTGGERLPPPQERLYTGGPQSVRGVDQNELGAVVYLVDIRIDSTRTPFDTIPAERPVRVIPLGGNSLIVANLEYRITDHWFPDLIQHRFFVDAGRLWTRGVTADAEVRFRVFPGYAIHLFTPVGQFQLNVGYKGAYHAPAGAAYYNFAIAETGSAPLVCVSPRTGSAAGSASDPSNCPATYVPTESRTFTSKLKWTISYGVVF